MASTEQILEDAGIKEAYRQKRSRALSLYIPGTPHWNALQESLVERGINQITQDPYVECSKMNYVLSSILENPDQTPDEIRRRFETVDT